MTDEKRCLTCDRLLDTGDRESVNCGGDCRKCMADAGDPDCIEALKEEVPADIDTHSYYYPSDQLVPITPQARKAGFVYPVYVTARIWARALSWTGASSKRKTNVERRIFQLLEACSEGLQKKLAGDPNDEEGFVYFKFKHFFWDKGRDEAKKKTKMKMGCRLFLHPDDGKPWMCVLDPDYDYALELKKGAMLEAANDNTGDSDEAG